MTPHRWLLLSIVFVIVEILPPPTHFFFLCMAFGALGGAIAAAYSTIPWVPWAIFVLASVALVPVLIPLAKLLFTPKETPSNVDELRGAKAIVLQALDSQSAGIVKIRGEEWRAISEGPRFEKDATVEIIKVEGTQLLVRRPS